MQKSDDLQNQTKALQLSIDGTTQNKVAQQAKAEAACIDDENDLSDLKGKAFYPADKSKALFKSQKHEKKKTKENLFSVIKRKLSFQQLRIKAEKAFAKPMSEEEQKEKLAQAEKSVSKKSSKKSKLKNLFFFFLNIAIVAGILAYQLTKEEFAPLSGLRFSWTALLVIVALFCALLFAETLIMGYLMKISTNRWALGFSFKLTFIGRYYDNVTPMATGGQPFQIAYSKSHGLPMHTSLSIPFGKYIFGQIAWFILSLVCLIYSIAVMNMNVFVMTTSIIGFVLGSVVLIVAVFLSVCKTVGKKLVVKVLRMLYKMKIVKNYDKQYEKITKYISDFQDVMQQYAKSPKDFLFLVGMSIVKMLFHYSIPFFIIYFFNGSIEGEMFIPIFVMCNLVDMASSFFPLPGGTGMNEISFAAAFGSIVGQGDILVWVLLGWRFFSYYVYLLLGIFILSYDVSYGNRKYRWNVCRQNLIEESNQFKQIQIDNFRMARSRRRKKA